MKESSRVRAGGGNTAASAWGDGWFCHHVETHPGTQLLLESCNVPKCMMWSQPTAECGRAQLLSLKPRAAVPALSLMDSGSSICLQEYKCLRHRDSVSQVEEVGMSSENSGAPTPWE